MRTTEDLKLAAAILVKNISTTKPHHRVVSSTNVFIAWQTSPTGEFANFLRQNIRSPSAEARFDAIRLGSTSINLLDAAKTLREMLDAQSLRDGSVRGLVKKAHFRTVVMRSTAIRAGHETMERTGSPPHRGSTGKPAPVSASISIAHPRPRAGGEKPISSPSQKVTRVFVSLQHLYVHNFDTDYDACDGKYKNVSRVF